MKNVDELGKIIIKKLRDENFEYYLSQRKKAESMTLEDYYKLPRNPNYAPELQKIDDERFELLNSLNENQKHKFDKLILNILDFTAFNFLREIEENLDNENGIGLTINGKKIEEINQDFLSGTLFGEYFLWCQNCSEFGEYQQ
ncbi:hypothetical protein [Chryseobacterium sp.]|uniref:hypothetical protein n=1 Tax=Chryseobacterium sp. TaxID=1871047 RepID=UPI0028A053EA|nr:hypothetical protein [Chryseobacterium sp.]